MSARPVIRQLAQLDDYVSLSNPAAGTAGLRSLGSGATQAVAGNDARLSDTRVPTDGSVTNAKVAAGAGIAYSKLALTNSIVEGDLAFGIATQTELDAHAAAADPHTGYRLESVPITAAMVAADVATQAELDAAALLAPIKAPADAARNTITPASNTVPWLTFSAPTSAGNYHGLDFNTLGTAKFTIGHAATTYHGVRDDILVWGYNIMGTGQQRVAGENSLYFAMESNYRQTGAGPNLAELNLDYISADGLTGKRFMTTNIDRATNLGSWAYLADQVYPNGGFRIEEAPNDFAFGFYPVGSKRCAFRYAGGGGSDLQIGYDGGADAPDSMSIGPSALNDYNGVFLKKVSGSTQVAIGTDAPNTGARLTVIGNVNIGNIAPQHPLQVYGTIKAGGTAGQNQGFVVLGDDASAAQNVGIFRSADNGAIGGNYLNLGGYSGVILSAGNAALGLQVQMLRVNTAGLFTWADSANFAFGTAAGTKIGTATTQKIGLWNATPVVQPAAVADVTGTAGAVYTATEQTMLNDLKAQLNALLARLRAPGVIAT